MATILVVDDESEFRKFVRECLEAAGHSVVESADGVQGLATYKVRNPDLVITDMFMPEKGGLKLIRELRDHNTELRIIAMSGSSMLESNHFRAYACELDLRTLLKPFSAQTLVDTVNQSLADKRLEGKPTTSEKTDRRPASLLIDDDAAN
jgi:CheY-like chemotaxis protein